ncbi:Chemotaxis protein CheA [Lacunisphaera limnophila]|uniref:histidine kinase n=1 Tax=Lacunisphaera limnophila TaxID=1838286 RepID=A0A1D8AXK4_9BACT|nr:chemotaxis protein CheA [Lacunisphaera limnophila]AOS45618.1 Chemotaxis protein CheA [Lacunisphaera limnophila]
MNNDLQQQFVRDMLTESYEGLDRYEQVILELEQGAAPGDRLNEIFRAIHTLKGTAGCLGFGRIQKIAHVGEGLLDHLRAGRLQINPAISSSLLRLSDALREILQSIDTTGVESTTDHEALTQTLQDLRDGKAAALPPIPAATPVPSPLPPPAPVAASETAATPNATWGLFDDEPAAATPAAPAADAANWGLFDDAAAPAAAAPADLPSADLPSPSAAPREARAASGPAAAGSTVRVDITLLDKLMNLVGELVLARNQLGQVSLSRQHRPEQVGEISQRINLITGELQENMMKTRMQPIETVWGKFPRIVRDIAQELGKQIRLDTFGADTELDRTIIEAIRDPLTHIVRNAVDHGLESPAVRTAAGKSPEGSLIMRAFHEGGQVIIEIIDDGAGVNIARVKAKALEKNLLTPEQAARLSDRDAVNLIFAPGFSTAETVTNISGRGVGMDVVRTNIEKIGGSVDVHSTPGQGTTLKIKIPLTLAIIPALLVEVARQRYAIPQVNLLELVRLEGAAARAALEHVYDSPVFRLRGQLMPLVFLDRELKLPAGPLDQAPSDLQIVVLQADGRRFGLVVSEVCDTQEIVVKPLSRQLKGLPMFAGATILGDGCVALILDVLGLANHARITGEQPTTAVADPALAAAGAGLMTRLLLFSVPGRDHLALPLDKTARLEEFAASKLERSGTREAVQYRDGILPLVRLDRVLPGARAVTAQARLPVIVYQQGPGKTVGLVVHEIRDIVEDRIQLQEGTAAPGISGSAIIQGTITDLVDVPAILRAADRAA